MNNLKATEKRLLNRLTRLRERAAKQKAARKRATKAKRIREARFRQILSMKSNKPAPSFREIGAKWRISGARAHAIYKQALQWRKNL